MLMATAVFGQDYQYEDYGDQDFYAQGEDTLYHDYAQNKELKAAGGGG